MNKAKIELRMFAVDENWKLVSWIIAARWRGTKVARVTLNKAEYSIRSSKLMQILANQLHTFFSFNLTTKNLTKTLINI